MPRLLARIDRHRRRRLLDLGQQSAFAGLAACPADRTIIVDRFRKLCRHWLNQRHVHAAGKHRELQAGRCLHGDRRDTDERAVHDEGR